MSALIRLSLWTGVGVPVVYFGAQAAAIPFYPGYDLLVNSASQLGSDASHLPEVLNSGAMLSGVMSVFSSVGLLVAMLRVGAPKMFAAVSALCVVSIGLAALWAGLHPMPDPAHNPGALGIGMFLSPFALLASVWRVAALRGLRTYLMCVLVAFAGLVPVMAGLTPVDLQAFGGLMQRIAALVLYLPPSVACWVLLRKSRST